MPVPEFLSGSKTLNTPLPSYSSKDPRKRRLSEPPNDRYFLMFLYYLIFFSPFFFPKSRLYTYFFYSICYPAIQLCRKTPIFICWNICLNIYIVCFCETTFICLYEVVAYYLNIKNACFEIISFFRI